MSIIYYLYEKMNDKKGKRMMFMLGEFKTFLANEERLCKLLDKGDGYYYSFFDDLPIRTDIKHASSHEVLTSVNRCEFNDFSKALGINLTPESEYEKSKSVILYSPVIEDEYEEDNIYTVDSRFIYSHLYIKCIYPKSGSNGRPSTAFKIDEELDKRYPYANSCKEYYPRAWMRTSNEWCYAECKSSPQIIYLLIPKKFISRYMYNFLLHHKHQCL